MNIKNSFQSDKDLARWWSAACHDDRFSKVLLYVRSEFLDSGTDATSPEGIRGARMFENILLTIADNEETTMRLPGPGLNHDLDNDLRQLQSKYNFVDDQKKTE